MTTLQVKKFQFDEDAFRALILNVVQREQDDDHFGAVKLNKILFYSDFIAYRRLGEPITGADYIKLSEGPAPRQMLPIRSQMESERLIEIQPRQFFNYVQHQITWGSEAESSRWANHEFSMDQAFVIAEVIKMLKPMTASQASDWSHREVGWRITPYKERIPYETAWLEPEPVPQEAEADSEESTASPW